MSQLRSLYGGIDLAMVDRFVNEHKQEDVHLDFKRMGDRVDRKSLAIGISGFANSDGGIIVWGIDAHKDSSGVDAAQEKVPIGDVRKLLSELQSYTGDAVNPIVDGVEHKVIVEGNDAGYLVTHVPASDSVPHMAKFGVDRYYKRSGDSFYRMEHYDLADVFGRRPNPVLSLYAQPSARLTNQGPREKTFGFTVVFGIENSGKGTAKYPSLSLSFSPPYRRARYGLDGNGRTGLPVLPTSRQDRATLFGGGSDHVVYPGSVLEVTKLQEVDFRFAVRKPARIEDLRVPYRIASEGITVLDGVYELEADAILALIEGLPEL